MTHQEQYDAIINFRKSNPLPKDQYGENHHIVPKSICPLLKDAPDNIIRLSAQEHFLAHYHLWLAYSNELKEKIWAKKMCFAFHRMKQQLLKCDDVESMAKLYEEVRVEFVNLNSGKNSSVYGRHWKLSEESCKRHSEAKIGIKNPMYGMKRSLDARRKCSESLKGHRGYWTGKTQPKEVKEKRAAKIRGRRQYTNGIVNVRRFDCPEGFWLGTTRKSKQSK